MLQRLKNALYNVLDAASYRRIADDFRTQAMQWAERARELEVENHQLQEWHDKARRRYDDLASQLDGVNDAPRICDRCGSSDSACRTLCPECHGIEVDR